MLSRLYHDHRPIKMEPESPDEDLFAVYLKDLIIGDYGESLVNISPQPAPSTPYTEITEHPKQRDHRFRYPVEGRQAGSIAGERATSDLPSFPSVKVHNLNSRAKVVVSLVTKDEPHRQVRPHPHRLVGDSCRDGICAMLLDPQQPQAVFRKIGVQRTMNKEVENSLAERKRAGVRLPMDVDKEKTGKKYKYDMKAVRLFFEVFLETTESSGVYDKYLEPVVSSPVYDKKDTVLTICRVNMNNGTVAGGDELFILCEKVQSDDIKVKFCGRDPASQQEWNAFGIFGPSDVHRQFAIVCKTPRFMNQHITAAVTVKFKLYRPSDDESSNEMEFTYKPLDTSYGQNDIEKKKRKFNHKEESEFSKFFTSGGQVVKTETLGASAQSCSGAPVSNPVSNAQSTHTMTPVPTMMTPLTTMCDASSSMVRQNLRQRLINKADGGSRPSTPSSIPFTGGTAQPVDPNVPITTTTFTSTSEAHMSSGRMIQQHQPVSTDQGQYGIAIGQYDATQVLMSLATNQDPNQPMDEERQTSEQRIQAIANDLMMPMEGAAAGGNEGAPTANRVVVQQEPSSSYLFDVQFSSLETLDLAAFQDVTSGQAMAYDLVYGQQTTSMDVNNTSNSSNSNNNAESDTKG